MIEDLLCNPEAYDRLIEQHKAGKAAQQSKELTSAPEVAVSPDAQVQKAKINEQLDALEKEAKAKAASPS